MEEKQFKMIWNVAKNLIPNLKEKIREAAKKFIREILAEKDKIELLPGEVTVANLQYDANGVPTNAVVFLDEENRIVRFENVRSIDEIVENIISKID